jgi:hypothetical protein
MRLVTLDSREAAGRPGLLLPSGEILDLAAAPSGLTAAQWRPQSVVSVLAEGEEGRARVARVLAEWASATDQDRAEWRRMGRLLPAPGTRLMPPIRRPGLLLMVADPASGSSYVKNPNAAAGPEASVAIPAGDGAHLFLVGMVGLVLGRPLFRATAAEAGKAVAALTLVADLGTSRLAGNPEPPRAGARQFPGACVLGPALVTLDELPPGAGWRSDVAINGRSVGPAFPAVTAEGAAGLLADLSRRYAFRPGDIVGVPAGAGECELPAGSAVRLTLNSILELNFALGA